MSVSPQQAAELLARWPLERILTDPIAFGLDRATPLQRATCRAIDGLPLGELATHEDVMQAIGPVPSGQAWLDLYLVCAIRGGKSKIAAAAAAKMAASTDLSDLGREEVARVSVLSLDKRKAGVILEHLRDARTRPLLGAVCVGPPKSGVVSVTHPSGRTVQIEVLAGKRAGGATVSFWSAGVIHDEATRMLGGDEGVVNLDESLRAMRGRLLPGAKSLCVGSPWAPRGPVYEAKREYWRRPARGTLVVCGTGPQMNPTWWTPERCAELRERDPIAYRTDVLAEFVDADGTFFDPTALDRAVLNGQGIELPRLPKPGEEVTAGGDLAFRRNSSALCIVHRSGPWLIVAELLELRPTPEDPLRPSQVIARFADRLRAHRATAMVADDHYAESVREHLSSAGLALRPIPAGRQGLAEMYLRARALFYEGRVKLPNNPRLLSQLRSVVAIHYGDGHVRIHKPEMLGSHADLADALVFALWEASGAEVEAPRDAAKAAHARHWDPELVEDPLERAVLEEQKREERERRYG